MFIGALRCYGFDMTNRPESYVLCSNPRSGTTLLCDLLTQTGVAGRPNSFFRQKSLHDWCEDWQVPGPVDPEDPAFSAVYFDAMRKEGRAGRQVFGLRLMGPDLQLACDWIRRQHSDLRTDVARFEAAFGPTRFIHLSRQDKLAEAISYIRAEQTGLWHANPDGSTMEYLAPTRDDAYDEAAITHRLKELMAYDQAWHSWFREQGVTPLTLSYEALAADPVAEVRRILSYIGQDPDKAAQVTPGVRKLADQTNAAWISRYRQSHPNS